MKKLKRILILPLILLLILLSYVAYVFISYYRIEDNLVLEVEYNESKAEEGNIKIGDTLTATSYNIGFGAYTPDFSFFMDGGKYSRAKNKESVISATTGASSIINEQSPDFALFQEVDLDGTRSHHVNEYEIIKQNIDMEYATYAINYDSPYLFYPITSPHGKNKSSLANFAKYRPENSIRRSLPISNDVSKLTDLDRAYIKQYYKTEKGNYLVIYNAHLSAYSNDENIRSAQADMLFSDMEEEFDKGNYILCGGDFNRDLKAREGEVGVFSWAYPLERSLLKDKFYVGMDALFEEERDLLWNSSRNADIPYDVDKSLTTTLDGFILSNNIDLVNYNVMNTGFKYSDHEPVVVSFKLK